MMTPETGSIFSLMSPMMSVSSYRQSKARMCISGERHVFVLTNTSPSHPTHLCPEDRQRLQVCLLSVSARTYGYFKSIPPTAVLRPPRGVNDKRAREL